MPFQAVQPYLILPAMGYFDPIVRWRRWLMADDETAIDEWECIVEQLGCCPRKEH